MKSIVWYVSGHGFGHASRQVEIINALGALRPDIRLIIRTAVSPGLLERTIRVPHDLRPGVCDAGIIQSSSIAHDDEATVEAAVSFQRDFADRVGRDAAALQNDAVRLVVGDIPPLAFEVAATVGVPSIAIGNFTWDWIYETHPGMHEAAPWLVPEIRRAYARATLALELPFAGGFDVFPRSRPIPLVARHATRSRDESRAHFGVPVNRRVALLSFGGYGLPALDPATVDCLDEWTVVTTDRILSGAPAGSRTAAREVVVLPERVFLDTGFRYEDLVAAADVVISKPGYGIIAECIANRTAFLYTSRGAFREYDVLVAGLEGRVRSRFIPQADLLAGRWGDALSALVRQPDPTDTMPTNGAEIAAAIITEVAGVT